MCNLVPETHEHLFVQFPVAKDLLARLHFWTGMVPMRPTNWEELSCGHAIKQEVITAYSTI